MCPDMVRQETYGYLLTPLCHQRPDLPGSKRSGYRPRPGQVQEDRPHRRCRVADPAFSPEHHRRILARVMTDVTSRKNLNPCRRDRTYPRSSSPAATIATATKDQVTLAPHDGPATIRLATQSLPAPRHDQLHQVALTHDVRPQRASDDWPVRSHHQRAPGPTAAFRSVIPSEPVAS